MRANRMGRWQGLGLHRAHFLEDLRDVFLSALRKLFHGSHQAWILFCQDLDTHLSWLMHYDTHTHMDLPLSQSGLGLTYSPSFPSPPLGLWHQELTLFLVAYGGESGHTLWLTLLTGHTFHLPRHCWTSSPDASPHLSHHDTMISFTHSEMTFLVDMM